MISGRKPSPATMSAFGGKADMKQQPSACPRFGQEETSCWGVVNPDLRGQVGDRSGFRDVLDSTLIT